MKNKTTLLSSVALMIGCLALFFFLPKKKHQHKVITAHKQYAEKANRERSDMDAQERQHWEWQRLHDPATGKIPAHIRQEELAYAATLPKNTQSWNEKTNTAPITWTNRGPWNVGGRTRALGVDVANDSIIVAGACSGGMWRSTDGGSHWAETTPAATEQSVSCLSQDTRPGHTNVWYYGTGEAYGASASGGGNAYFLGNGLYKSTDDGASWTSLTATANSTPDAFSTFWQAVWNVAADPGVDTADVVYAATIGALYKSTDGGTTWTAAMGGSTSSYSYFTDVAISPTGVIYATMSSDGPQKGIWRSTDGVNFTNITPPNFPTTYNRIVIGITPQDENKVYFLANTPGFGIPDTNFLGDVEWNSFWKYTYLSGNGDSTGGAWVDRSMNLPNGSGQFAKYNCQGSYDMVVKVKPDDSNTVYIGGTNLYRSTDGFADTTHTTYIAGYAVGASLPVVVSYPNQHPDQHCIVFDPNDPNILYSGNDGGIFRTDNDTAASVSWTSLDNGYITSIFYSVALDHATPGNNILIGGAQDNGSYYTNSTSQTSPWVHTLWGDGGYCAIADHQTAYYFSIELGKTVRQTLDANGNTTSFARIDPIGGKNYLFIDPFVLDPNNNNIMYLAGGKNLWRNNDLSGITMGDTWDSISTNWTEFPDTVPVANAMITALSISTTPANTLYYGTDNKHVYRIDSANTGTPTATDITAFSSPVIFPSAYVSCVAVDPQNANNVMVVFSNYRVYSIFYSTDGGTTWAKAAGNLEANAYGSSYGPSCRWASIMHVSDGTVYLVATSTGVYATDTLQGTSTVWVQQGVNTIGNAVCDMIDVRPSDGLVAVATHAHGFYTTHITSVNDVAAVHDIAITDDQLELKNYPNPFKDYTTIQFKLRKRAKVQLRVIDALGRTVKILVNGELSSGIQHVRFNKQGLAAGTYYYSLQVGARQQTKMMEVL